MTRRSPAGAAAMSTHCACGRRARRAPMQVAAFSGGDRNQCERCPRARGRDLARALSQRFDAGGPGAAAAPGIFLHRGLAAGFDAPPLRRIRFARDSGRSGSGPAQRHASGHRRGRTDAHPGRRARHRLGRSLDDHARHAQLHQSHAAAGSAGNLAGRAARPAAAAPSADHLPDQLVSSEGGSRPRLYRCRTSCRTFRWCTRTAANACAWRIWPFSARMSSTASRRCIPICCARRCFTISPKRRRHASSTRPTASPSGAGSTTPTRRSRVC